MHAEACPTQDLGSWVTAHVRMVEFWGGIFVPDSLRSGMTPACRYEPVIKCRRALGPRFAPSSSPFRARNPIAGTR